MKSASTPGVAAMASISSSADASSITQMVKHVLVGGVVVVAGCRPGADGGAGAGTALAGGRIAAGGGRARGLLGGAGEREDHAAHALIQHALGGPEFDHGHAREDGGGQPARGQHHERSVSSVMGECSISIHRKWKPRVAAWAAASTDWKCDGEAEGGLSGVEALAHGVAPGLWIGSCLSILAQYGGSTPAVSVNDVRWWGRERR